MIIAGVCVLAVVAVAVLMASRSKDSSDQTTPGAGGGAGLQAKAAAAKLTVRQISDDEDAATKLRDAQRTLDQTPVVEPPPPSTPTVPTGSGPPGVTPGSDPAGDGGPTDGSVGGGGTTTPNAETTPSPAAPSDGSGATPELSN